MLDDLRVVLLDDLRVVTTVASKALQMGLLRVERLVLMKVGHLVESKAVW